MPCFCTFFRSTLLEIKFCRNLFHYISFCSFWEVLKPTSKYTQHERVYCSEDKHFWQWRRTCFMLVINISWSNRDFILLQWNGQLLLLFASGPKVCNKDKMFAWWTVPWVRCGPTVGQKFGMKTKYVCIAKNPMSALNLAYICNCWESVPNTNKKHSW